METAHIREFLMLAERCNYREASERLFISRTALFKHIKELESEIGSPLFEKTGKRIVLSEFGQMFLPYAARVIDLTDQFQREVELRRSDIASIVMIGTQYRVVELVTRFLSQTSRYLVRTVEGGTAEDFLYKKGCELAFVCDLEDPEGRYESVRFTRDSLAAVMSPDHPLAGRESVGLRELRHEKFISMPQSTDNMYDLGLRSCREAGFLPKVVMTASPGSEVARLVREGVGIALLYRNVVRAAVSDVVTVDIYPPVDFEVSLCWRRDRRLSAGARAFIDYAVEYSKTCLS